MKREIPKPSIVALFEHYGSNVHSGFGWVKATCVLHEDRNPSASVNDETCRWHCFSCGESGDAVDLVQKLEGVSFAAAVDILNEAFGKGETSDQSNGLTKSGKSSRSGRRNWTPAWKSF